MTMDNLIQLLYYFDCFCIPYNTLWSRTLRLCTFLYNNFGNGAIEILGSNLHHKKIQKVKIKR